MYAIKEKTSTSSPNRRPTETASTSAILDQSPPAIAQRRRESILGMSLLAQPASTPTSPIHRPIQRKITLGGDEEYNSKVVAHIKKLMDDNLAGVIISNGGATIEMDPSYAEKVEEFINFGKSASAKLIRSRIAHGMHEDRKEWGIKSLNISPTDEASTSDGMAGVNWNAGEQMICYTEKGFQLNPPEILLAHEIGHADGFLMDAMGTMNPPAPEKATYHVPDALVSEHEKPLDVGESPEELRNTGIPAKEHPLPNPFSENDIRKERGLPQRLVYSKLVSWWIKDGVLTMDQPFNKQVLALYRRTGLPGVLEIVRDEVVKVFGTDPSKAEKTTNAIMAFIEKGAQQTESVKISELGS